MPIFTYPDPLQLVRPASKTVTVTKTRPANTVTYAVGSVVNESTSAGTVWTFASCARTAAAGGIIQAANLIISTAQTLKFDGVLWLFDTAPATVNDNVAWAPTDAEMKTFVAALSFSNTGWKSGTGLANGQTELKGLSDSFQCAAASTSLFGVLVANNAYVPTSAEDITIRLRIIQD